MYSEVSVAARTIATTGAATRAADFSETDGSVDEDESVDARSREDDDNDEEARRALISAAPGEIVATPSGDLPGHRRPPVAGTTLDIDTGDVVCIHGYLLLAT